MDGFIYDYFNCYFCWAMKTDRITILAFFKRKAVTLFLMIAFTAGAFATLGDGKGKDKNKSLFSSQRMSIRPGYFSLKSDNQYRGSIVIDQSSRFIFLNTSITYQKGNTTYIVPLKKKVILENVKLRIDFLQIKQ
jgi:hypothetical protein